MDVEMYRQSGSFIRKWVISSGDVALTQSMSPRHFDECHVVQKCSRRHKLIILVNIFLWSRFWNFDGKIHSFGQSYSKRRFKLRFLWSGTKELMSGDRHGSDQRTNICLREKRERSHVSCFLLLNFPKCHQIVANLFSKIPRCSVATRRSKLFWIQCPDSRVLHTTIEAHPQESEICKTELSNQKPIENWTKK